MAQPEALRVGLGLAASTIAGAVIMALELAAFRLYAPYFGYSIYVWGAMISIVMAALAAGYGAGGWISDRTETDLPVHAALLASGLYQLLVLSFVFRLLPALARYDDPVGPTAATLIIFAPPMGLLATVSPLVIRWLARPGHVGAAAGKVYALATAGSMAGILVTSFYLLPEWGTRATLEALAAVPLLLAVIGLVRRRRIALGALAVLPALPLMPAQQWPSDTLWAGESAYNSVRVARSGTQLVLFLNNDAAQTIRDESSPLTGYYYDQFALGPLLVPARRALVLGMGAGGSIAATRLTAPDIEFDAVEIDPQVVRAALRWFGVGGADPRLHLHIADARRWLADTSSRFDLVHVDLYQGGPYIPFYLITEEFFRLVRAHMGDDALLMLNLFDLGARRELLSATAATLAAVFPSVLTISGPHGNHMIFAFTRRRSLEAVRARLAADPGDIAQGAAKGIAVLGFPPGTRRFTDDRAPVEEITRQMLRRARLPD